MPLFEIVNQKIKAHQEILNVINKPICLDEIKKLSNSTKQELKNYYFDHFRNIQYYLPNHIYSDFDQTLLDINSKYFSG